MCYSVWLSDHEKNLALGHSGKGGSYKSTSCVHTTEEEGYRKTH